MRFFCAAAVAWCKTETVLRPSPCGSAVPASCEDPSYPAAKKWPRDVFVGFQQGRSPTGIQGPPLPMESNRAGPALDPEATAERPMPARGNIPD